MNPTEPDEDDEFIQALMQAMTEPLDPDQSPLDRSCFSPPPKERNLDKDWY